MKEQMDKDFSHYVRENFQPGNEATWQQAWLTSVSTTEQ